MITPILCFLLISCSTVHADTALQPPITIEDTIRQEALKRGLTGEQGDNLIDIATCESGLDQTSIHTNTNGFKDIGLFQISTEFWLDTSSKLEYDIYIQEGNIEMAIYIYKLHGNKPWLWSKKCWDVPKS